MALLQGEQLCKFILKSIQNCWRYGPDKYVTFKSDLDLDLGPTCAIASNDTSTRDGEQLCQIILKSIHNYKSYGLDKFGWTQGYTHIHQTVVITTMSRSPQAGSTKISKFFYMTTVKQITTLRPCTSWYSPVFTGILFIHNN